MFNASSSVHQSLFSTGRFIRIYFFIFFVLTATFLRAETAAAGDGAAPKAPVQVDGVVKDTSGALVPGAHVRFTPQDGAPVEVFADDAGAFRSSLQTGHYLLSAVQTGYEQEEEPLDIAAGAPVHLQLTLKIQGTVESITVTSETGYAATSETSATKVPMRMLDTPQSVYSVTSQIIEDRGVTSLQDALAMVPGVQAVSLGEARRDQVLIRGFAATNDMYIDGVRDNAQYFRDLSNTERIEVVEGPAAVLYGRGSSGGLINRITRRPQMEGLQGQAEFTGGSYGDKRFQSDIDDTWLGGKLGGRLTGAAESSGSQRNYFYMNRYAFAPTLRWRPSEKTDVYAQWERLRDERLPDRGVAAIDGPLGPVPIGNYYGYILGDNAAPHDFTHTSSTDETLDIRHDFDDGWHAHNVFRQAGDLVQWSQIYLNQDLANGIFGSDGVRGPSHTFTSLFTRAANPGSSIENPLISRGQTNAVKTQQDIFDQLEAYRSGRFLGMDHLLLVGAEYGRETQDLVEFVGTAPNITLYNPAPDLAPTLATTPSVNTRAFAQTAAVYSQDLIQLAPKWKVLAGVRFDNYKQEVANRLPGTTNLARVDNDFSPRVGLLYQPTSWSTAYFSYSRTFDPSGESLTQTTSSAQLPPQVTTNYEGGAKFSNFGDKLVSSIAVYDLDRTNILQINPINPTQLLSVGEQRTIGTTVSFQGSLNHHWMVYGGYSWQNAEIVKSPTTFNGVSYTGKRPNDVPVNNGSLWTTYNFANGFGAGGGFIFNTDSFAANDNLLPLPGFTRLDALFYYRKPHWNIDAHLNNLTNTKYYETAHSDLEFFPGAPISGSVTLRYRF